MLATCICINKKNQAINTMATKLIDCFFTTLQILANTNRINYSTNTNAAQENGGYLLLISLCALLNASLTLALGTNRLL